MPTTTTMVEAPDGTELFTETHLPRSVPATTVLIRTPYMAASHRREAEGWVRRGYAVAVQDVRGRYGSGGTWEPYRHEAGDGAATVDALVAAPWSDGRVVCHGVSYGAHCAVAAALRRPDLVAAVVASVPALTRRRVARDRDGAPRFFGHSWWWLQHGEGAASRALPIHDADASQPGPMAVLPPLALAEAVGVPSPSWAAGWEVNGAVRSTATPLDPPVPPDAHQVPPLLVIGGLHDVFRDDALDLGAAWPGHADLLVGAWQHDLGLVSRGGTGDLRRDPGHDVKVGRLIADWLDGVLDGVLHGGPGLPQPWTSIALEGSADWARPGVGDDLEIGLRPLRQHFVADPRSPHPSLLGPVDASAALRRADDARYSSGPLGAAVDLVGRPRVTLSGLSATGPDGTPVDGPVDWAVRLVLRTAAPDRTHTDADTIQLAHGLIRTAMPAATLTLPLTSRRLHVGAQLEIQVSGHQFPLYARDPQDGSEPLIATDLHVAERTVGAAVLSLPLGRPGPPPAVRSVEGRS